MALDLKSKNWDVPFIGEIDRNWILLGGVGTVALVFLVRYRMKKTQTKQQQQQPTEVYIAGQLGTDPAGNSGPIDPETGYVYGSPEDLERLGELSIEEYSEAIYYPPQMVPDVAGEHGHEDEDGKGRRGKRTNAQWVRDALADFSDEFGRDHLEDVLYKVLAGHPVTSAQKAMFLEVVSREGPPPQGYPKPIKLLDTDAQPKPVSPPSKLALPKAVSPPSETPPPMAVSPPLKGGR
jgi:hypothetical protein